MLSVEEIPESVPLIVGALSDSEMSIRLKARNALVALAKNGSNEASEALSRHAGGSRNRPESYMTISVIEKRPKLDKLANYLSNNSNTKNNNSEHNFPFMQ